jgi:hypothetical protein
VSHIAGILLTGGVKVRILLIVTAAIVSAANVGIAASPEIAGVYHGNIVGKNYLPETAAPAPYKGDMTLTINADNSYQINLFNSSIAIVGSSGGFFGTNNGTINANGSHYHFNASLHFKNGNVKAVILYATDDGSASTQSVEAKFTGKKAVL